MNNFKLVSEKTIDKYLSKVTSIWNDIGLPDAERSSRLQMVVNQITASLAASLDAENQFKQSLECKLNEDFAKLRLIEGELGVEPYKPTEGLNTFDVTDALQAHYEALLLLKKERHIRYLTTARDLLLSLAKPKLNDIEELIMALDEKVSSNDLQQCYDELLEQLTSNRAVVLNLHQKLTGLFDILKIPADEQVAQWSLLGPHDSAMFTTIEQLHQTIGEYERLKEQRFASMINAARQELCGLWDACGFDDLQRSRQCQSYFTDEENESSLTDLLGAVQVMKKYFDDTLAITSRIERRQKAWFDLLEVEKRSSDPERLMNRGGCLLKDEQERKRLMAELKKFDREIIQHITAFETSSQLEYSHNGQKFETFIAEQWHDFSCLKEKDKENRLMKKSQKLEEELRYGSRPATTKKKRFAGFASNKHSSDANKVKVSHVQQTGSSHTSGVSLGCAIMARDVEDEHVE